IAFLVDVRTGRDDAGDAVQLGYCPGLDEDSEAAAQHGLVAEHRRAVGEADARAEEPAVGLVRRAIVHVREGKSAKRIDFAYRIGPSDPRNTFSSCKLGPRGGVGRRWVETIYGAPELFAEGSIDIEAPSQVQRQFIAHPPVILNERPDVVSTKGALRIDVVLARGRLAELEVRKVSA